MGCAFFIGCQPSSSGGSEQCLSILISIYSILRFAVIQLGKGPEWEMDLLSNSAQWCCNSWFASGDSGLLICLKVSWDAKKVYLFSKGCLLLAAVFIYMGLYASTSGTRRGTHPASFLFPYKTNCFQFVLCFEGMWMKQSAGLRRKGSWWPQMILAET